MAHQEPFFTHWSREFLLRGGNRSGKSTCAAARFAAIATDTPITLDDGRQINLRQPWQRGRCLRMWVVAFDSSYIGQTIHRLLFKSDLFKVIKDEQTGLHRAFKPWSPQDAVRESEAKAAPPLIPSRYVDPASWVWDNKKAKEFKKVVIRDPLTGAELAEIYAFSSKADPKAGDPVDVIWIDESIDNANHYPEWQARLVDLRGNLFWSSWPAINNDALAKLTERAAQEYHTPNPLVRELVISLSDNKALSDLVRREALGMYATEDERRARDKGEYVTDQLLAYPLFDEYLHQAVYDGAPDAISKILSKNNFIPPNDWCHELILDPGTAHPAVILTAIPPPHLGNHVIVYDEIYPGRADAMQLAKIVKERTGNRVFHRFIIDAKAGAQQQMGQSLRVEQLYINAFEKFKVRCTSTGHAFTWGCLDVGARMGKLQEWMHVDVKGHPKLRIVRHKCRETCNQLRLYKKACVNREIIDDRPARGQQIDLAVCCEYLAASNPVWVEPAENIDDGEEHYKWYMKLFGAKKNKNESVVIGSSY